MTEEEEEQGKAGYRFRNERFVETGKLSMDSLKMQAIECLCRSVVSVMSLSCGSSISIVAVATAFAPRYAFALRLIFYFQSVLDVTLVSSLLLF